MFGREGTFKKRFLNVGTPTALCITPRRRQVLYVAHSGHPDGMEDAAIYKIDLEGKIVGKVRPRRQAAERVRPGDSIDCRSENELFVGELANWGTGGF